MTSGFSLFDAAAIFGSRQLDPAIAHANDDPWVRWTYSDCAAHAFVLAPEEVELTFQPARLELEGLAAVGAEARVEQGRVFVRTPGPVPGRISMRLR